MSSMDDLAPMATGAGDGTSPKLGQELLHNVGLMVGLAETEIQASVHVHSFVCLFSCCPPTDG